MNEELKDILSQLKALTARLETLLDEPAQNSIEVTPPPLPPIVPKEPEPEPAIEPETSYEQIVFTLNDLYRFRRELFGNEAEKMSLTVDQLNSMTSESEVREYLAYALGWDLDEPVKAEFFAIVTERFKERPTLLA